MPADKQTLKLLGRMAVEAIDRYQRPITGRGWPVRTGNSLRGMGYQTGRDQIIVVNDADYAPDVERRTGAARWSLDQSFRQDDDRWEAIVGGEMLELLDKVT